MSRRPEEAPQPPPDLAALASGPDAPAAIYRWRRSGPWGRIWYRASYPRGTDVAAVAARLREAGFPQAEAVGDGYHDVWLRPVEG